MAMAHGKITIELDPIVKVYCKNFNCRHNLTYSNIGSAHCNLKYIDLDEKGCCKEQVEKVTKEEDK